MKTINCNQLLNYYTLEEFAVLDVIMNDGATEVFLTDGIGDIVYSCKESEMTEEKKDELRVVLNSFAAIAVYDFNRIKKELVAAELLSYYQPVISDVAEDLAMIIGTYDYDKEEWLIRDIDEVLNYYRYPNAFDKPEERAKAIVWLAEIVVKEELPTPAKAEQ